MLNTMPGLHLQEITAEHCAAGSSLYEALVQGEAVHAFGKGTGNSVEEDMHLRMAPTKNDEGTYQKRAYGLFMGDEQIPRYVVYTYFTHAPAHNGVVSPENYPSKMHDILLSENQPLPEENRPNIAVCYSISNIKPFSEREKESLKAAGIKKPGGNLLIDSVCNYCQSRDVTNLVTLSPMPDFDVWLKKKAENHDASMLDQRSWAWLATGVHKDTAYNVPGFWAALDLKEVDSPIERLYQLYQDDTYSRLEGPILAMTNDILRKVGRHYLKEAHKTVQAQPSYFDTVQYFHQGNGAQIAKITPQRETEQDRMLVTHPGGKSLNKLNVSYAYGLERTPEQAYEKRPATKNIDLASSAYEARLKPPVRGLQPPLP